MMHYARIWVRGILRRALTCWTTWCRWKPFWISRFCLGFPLGLGKQRFALLKGNSWATPSGGTGVRRTLSGAKRSPTSRLTFLEGPGHDQGEPGPLVMVSWRCWKLQRVAIGTTDAEVQALVESEDSNFRARFLWAELKPVLLCGGKALAVSHLPAEYGHAAKILGQWQKPVVQMRPPVEPPWGRLQ